MNPWGTWGWYVNTKNLGYDQEGIESFLGFRSLDQTQVFHVLKDGAFLAMVGAHANGYCNVGTGATQSTTGIAKNLTRFFLRHGNKAIHLGHHLILCPSNFPMWLSFCPGTQIF